MEHCNTDKIEYLSVWPPPNPSSPLKNEPKLTVELQTKRNTNQLQTSNQTTSLKKRSKDSGAEDNGNIIITSAETLLATWWRSQLRSAKKSRVSTEISASEDSIYQTLCPRAKIDAIKRHPSAKLFLQKEARKLESCYSLSSKQQYLLSTIFFNLASLEGLEDIEMKRKTTLSLLNDSQTHLLKCISNVLPCNYKNLEKLSNADYLHKIDEFDDFQKEVLAFSIKLDLQIQAEKSYKILHPDPKINENSINKEVKGMKVCSSVNCLTLSLSGPVNVDRIQFENLSVEQFQSEYCMKRKPLVISGIKQEEIVCKPWTLDHISEIAGSETVSLKKQNKDSIKWAKLEPSVNMSVADFISSVKSRNSENNYLFDWSLPLFCPKLNTEITIPKYFQQDYLKKTSNDALYRQSWPSLFISGSSSISDLHVDAFGSNFWMYLFKGRKRWTFFPAELTNALGPKYYESLDPVFDIDLSDKYTYEKVKCYASEVILEEGELLFVPSGSPHRVQNLEDSVAISGNFVDESNIECVVGHLKKNALQDPRAGDLVKEFIDLRLI